MNEPAQGILQCPVRELSSESFMEKRRNGFERLDTGAKLAAQSAYLRGNRGGLRAAFLEGCRGFDWGTA